MPQGIKLIVFPVKDIGRANALYTSLLGVQPYMDAAHYVGFRLGDQEIGLHPNGHAEGMTGPVGYCQVDDIEHRLKQLVDAGAQVQQGVKDVGGGKRTAIVRDADGNALGLLESP